MSKVEESIAGKVAIVTGGGSGIGRATCLALARAGARVTVVDRNREGLEETLEGLFALQSDEAPLGLCLDVGQEQDMEQMALRTEERFGPIDILVAAAGIMRPGGSVPKLLVDMTPDEWDAVIRVNLRGVFLSNRAVLARMVSRRQGHVVNLSSTAGRRGRAFDSAYCASKFGVIGLSEAAAEEVRSSGVKVQALLPDAVDTPLWQQNGSVPPPSEALAPERVADLIVYLLAMPGDCMLLNPTIAPFAGRRRRKKKASSE